MRVGLCAATLLVSDYRRYQFHTVGIMHPMKESFPARETKREKREVVTGSGQLPGRTDKYNLHQITKMKRDRISVRQTGSDCLTPIPTRCLLLPSRKLLLLVIRFGVFEVISL